MANVTHYTCDHEQIKMEVDLNSMTAESSCVRIMWIYKNLDQVDQRPWTKS